MAVDDQLKSFADRADRLDEEIKALRNDLAELYKEVTASGFDKKVFKKAVAKRRALTGDKAISEKEGDALLELYLGVILPQEVAKSPSAAFLSPANAIAAKQSSTRVPAREEIPISAAAEIFPAHDPVTGEILGQFDPGEIPNCLRRTAA